MSKYNVIVIGGGAAGLMCAIEAGKRGRTVLVLEHSERLGKKILISGGGRCNFTNLSAGPDNYLSSNPHFCKSALARYQPSDFLALVGKHKIAWHEKKLGQLFCDISSRLIVELLQKECDLAGVEIRLNCHIAEISRHTHFTLRTDLGAFDSESLVIATGGLSFPKIGASDFGYRVASQFGLKMLPTRPGLVPLTLGQKELGAFSELSGVSIDAVASCGHGEFRENILFTHRGLSGPAILQVSNYAPPGASIGINLFPERPALGVLTGQHQTNRELKTVLSQHLPQRFAQAWCGLYAPSRMMCQYSAMELASIASKLDHWQLTPSGTEGYPKAEVTLGGIDTRELSSKTMESRAVPGLYFIGEVVDVTGWLGGYNFQWAWASGHAAGQFA